MISHWKMNTPGPRGTALVAVFMILSLLASAIIALMQIAISNTNITDNTRDSYQALLMAQAGINHSINEFNVNKVIGTREHAVGSPSAFWGLQQSYVVTTVTNADDTISITSIGTFNNSQSAGNILRVDRKLQAVVARPVTVGKFLVGGFGRNSVTLTGLAQTDSYESGIGTSYEAQVAAAGGQANYDRTVGAGGHVASNGSITGTGNTVVHGNATPGPGFSVSLTGGAQVTGSTAPAPAPYNFASHAYSPKIPSSGNFSNNNATFTTGTYRFTDWKQTGGTITFSGGGVINLYLDGDLKQSGQGLVVLTAGTTVNIFQGASGSFGLSGQGMTNMNTIPSTFNVVSASTQAINVVGQGDIYATVYAPDANVKVSGQGQFFGAVIGNDLTLNGLGEFHYDKSATSPGITSNVVVLSYWEVDI